MGTTLNSHNNQNMTKVGLFGIGHDTYWMQFDGLIESIRNYQQQIKKLVRANREIFCPTPFKVTVKSMKINSMITKD